MITYIIIFTADHRPKAHIPTHAIPRFTGINLLQNPIFIDTNAVSLIRLARASALLAEFGFSTAVADCCAAVLSRRYGAWGWSFAAAGWSAHGFRKGGSAGWGGALAAEVSSHGRAYSFCLVCGEGEGVAAGGWLAVRCRNS